jgi:dienelactone hydrolase
MTVRRAAVAVALPLALFACAPEVEQASAPPEIVKAVFDSATATIPLPNDLALQSVDPDDTSGTAALLRLFIGGGGWPNDQEVAVEIPIQRLALQGDGSYAPATTPAAIDLATVTSSTAALLRIDSGTPVPVPFEAVYEAAPAGSFGLLRLRAAAAADGSRHWAPGGRYVVALRGGSAGVRTTEGTPLSADLVTSFIAQGKDLTVEEFQPPGLPPALAGQLEQLRQLYVQPLTWTASGTSWIPQSDPDLPPAFEAVDTVFPSHQAASIQTFGVEDGTHVAGDPDAGQIPLPSDFLLEADGTVVFNDAFGPAAPGLDTLDGFSTTGILLAPTTGPIDALSVSRTSVLVFEAGGVWLHDLASALAAENPGLARYVTQPPQLNAYVGGTTVSSTIGLQPAVPVSIQGVGDFFLPPLAEKTTYVVVVTDRVLDAEGRPLKRGTLGKLLLTYEGDLDALPIFEDDPATAAGLEAIRDGLAPLLDALPDLTGDPTLTKDDVVMAYPVTTQTVTDVSVGLSALPYDPNQDSDPSDSVIFAPQDAVEFDPADLGYPGAFTEAVAFYESAVTTLDAIDVTTGALDPDPGDWTPRTIPALVAVPDPANVPPCGAAGPPFCAPLVVFHHGLGGGRLTALPFAEALAARGFVVAAIDAPYHGDRAFCDSDADCNTGGTCTPIPGAEGQGDAVPPGTCDNGLLFDPARLTTVASGNYFVSANFFRTRDAIRQDLLDHAALVLALARPPASSGFPQPASNPLAEVLLADHGIVIDPTRVYLDGISLGGVVGTQIAAANPRFSRAVLSVAGGTVVDALTSSPAFDAQVDQIFLDLGIDRDQIATDPAVAAAYLRTLLVAKWVLDPAEPLNYAANVPTKLASPLHAALGPLASTTTDAYGQVANCDQVIPNPFNLLLLETGGIPYTFYVGPGDPPGCVSHGFLGTSADGQGHAAEFLLDLFDGGTTTPESPFALP